MKPGLLSASVFTLFLAMFSMPLSGQTSPSPPSRSETGLEGVITVGPIHGGPVRPGVPSSKPLVNTEFAVVETEKGAAASFKTDDQGRFKISLGPGHYRVAKKEERTRIGRCGPFDVDVVAGQMTKVQWYCDTGMR